MATYSGGSARESGSRYKTEKVSSHSEKNMSPAATGTGSGPFLYIILFPASLMMYAT